MTQGDRVPPSIEATVNKVDAGQNVIKVLKACVHPDQIPSCKACDRMTCEKCVASVKQEAWNESILAEHDTMFLMDSGAWDSCAQEDEFEGEADVSRERSLAISPYLQLSFNSRKVP